MAAVLTSEYRTVLATSFIKCDMEKYIRKIFKFPMEGLDHTFFLQKAVQQQVKYCLLGCDLYKNMLRA
jgi:hypothetical protein